MNFVEKLNDRIRSKITPEVSARITAMRGRDHGNDITSESHRTVAQAAQIEDATPGMQM